MKKYCIGIDLGGTTVKFGLFGPDGTLYRKWRIPTDISEAGKFILRNITDSLNQTLAELNIRNSELIGIGAGVPGLVTEDGFVTIAANLGWINEAVAEKLRLLTGLPVMVCNDANAAALGEMWKGSGEGHKNLVMITLGTGIGGGVIIGEKIVNGVFGGGGEIGHMPVVYDEISSCRCGRKGCLEQVASATGMVREAKRYLKEIPKASVLREKEAITLPKILAAAKSGDHIAKQVIERAGKFLGLALASITSVLDPEVYIIGGGVSGAGDYFLTVIKEHYRKNVLYACRETKICLAKLGNDAGIYGAARMVL